MTYTEELDTLINKAVERGAVVRCTYDREAWAEGRTCYESISVTGAPGIGSYPMSPIYAAEKLRAFVAEAV